MASACVNSSPAISWLGPRVSFDSNTPSSSLPVTEPDIPANNSPERSDLPDFEFRLDDPVAMLPADELFSQGKLVPLQMAALRSTLTDISTAEIRSAEPVISQRGSEISGSDPYLFSPKAPRCSSRWREFLGLRKLQNLRSEPPAEKFPTSRTPNPRSIRLFLNHHRNTKSSSSNDSSLNLPLLLRDSDSESTISLSSSRLSLSSTSSSSDSSDLPRLSLDSEKPNQASARAGSHRIGVGGPTRVRVSRPVRRVSADAESPRMNSSGKVVFNGGSLERSSSSPGSFYGGCSRVRPRGMERSYSANVVRVNPVLNMPVCSLRGSGKSGSVFGFFSSEKRKEKDGPKSNGKTKAERVYRD